MIYLDNAATSRYKPNCVLSAVEYEIRHAANPGRSGHNSALLAAEKISSARETLIEFFDAAYHNVVFTKNCTEALNLAFNILTQGHVIVTANEHNSVLRPLYRLAADNLITLSVVYPTSDGCIEPIEIERRIKKNTVMIAANHVSNVTGIETDLYNIGKIADKHGIIFVVDAAQSAGHIRIDMSKLKIDMLAAPAHKGLYGVQGCGFLIFNNILTVPPLLCGGTGTSSDSVEQPVAPPEAQEAGTLNTPAIAALNEGVKWTDKNFAALSKNNTKLTAELCYGLKNIGKCIIYSPENCSGVVSFNLDSIDCSAVADFLNEREIAVRSGLHCAPLIHRHLCSSGAVRVSVGHGNKLSDIRKLLQAVESLLCEVSRV